MDFASQKEFPEGVRYYLHAYDANSSIEKSNFVCYTKQNG
jgi:hypothetical protein